jgi:hypothetical protein
MQRVAKHYEASELAELHEQLVEDALADGAISPQERRDIVRSARDVTLAVCRQAIRNRLAVRMIRGGNLDRGMCIEIKDYQELLRQEEADSVGDTLAA